MSRSRFIRWRSASAPGSSRSATTCGSVPSPPRTARVLAGAGSEEVRVGHPVLGQVLDLGERLLHGYAPRVVGRPDPRCLRAPQDEAARPLGISGREDARHAAALGRTEDERALAPRSVHHGTDVVGSLFERRRGRRTVAHARPPFVEPDRSSERAQALDQGGRVRDLPEQLQCDTVPGACTRSTGLSSPVTWYATITSPLRAYLVSGRGITDASDPPHRSAAELPDRGGRSRLGRPRDAPRVPSGG